MSRNETYIANLLPISMEHLKEAVDRSEQLSQGFVPEFRRVRELIEETLVVVGDTIKRDNEFELQKIERDLKTLSGRRKTGQDVVWTNTL